MEGGEPLLATDPWLLGSNYWRSWWLEKYPVQSEIELVRRTQEIYITHSHPDHFHWPSLRALGPRPTLHPRFPGYKVPDFLNSNGYPAQILEPWRWRSLSDRVRICSIPVPFDDSILVIDTPDALIINLNDSSPRPALVAYIRRWLPSGRKMIIALKSYSPASAGIAFFRNGVRLPFKTKEDYATVAWEISRGLGATHFVPFASQAFFNRSDSRWANEYKVTYEDLRRYWKSGGPTLCPPFIDMNLLTGDYVSAYTGAPGTLDRKQLEKIAAREDEEKRFTPPEDFEVKLKAYIEDILPYRFLFRSGIGWRLSTSRTERFYNFRTRAVEQAILPDYDFIITIPDQVLYEALSNGVLTDIGITMLIRVDTRVSLKLTYAAFLLMGMRDYGYLQGPAAFLRFLRYYLPYVFPSLLRARALIVAP